MKNKEARKTLIPYFILFVIIMCILYAFNTLNVKVNEITYNDFNKNLSQEHITELEITPKNSAGVYQLVGKLEGYKDNETFKLIVPLTDSVIDEILTTAEEQNLKVDIKANPESNSVLTFILSLLPVLILVGATIFIFVKLSGGNKQSFDFGKSKAKLSQEGNKVTFKDVAGLKEEKEEVAELIDFLKNPKKFQRLGARIPKGVLLVGPPGTGKTLLAKAVAGEAKVPFYYISGSDFVELFVGVGASRVRDMFKQAKQTAPCLIFIDEIDAVGRQRGAGLGGGHDEREQTLNQLLTEMDGFGANEGIIIIAATNRPDVLDPALLRPGRFDRQVTVNFPDMNGRKEILEVHARNKKFVKGLTLEYIAQRTVGFSGADLENLLNEAALLAVRKNSDAISLEDLDEAYDRVIMGPAKKSKKYSEKEKKLVAYHEAGHAVVGIKLEDANEVQKITIVPRGAAGGYNLMLPKEEKFFSTKTELEQTICGLLGGRVAEEIVLKVQSSGAQNDFERATKIARSMVTEYGMSDLGPIQFEHQESSVFLGRDYNKSRNFSSQVAFEIDQEMRKIIETSYEKTKKIISSNRKLLDLIANTLLEKETLTKEEIDSLVKTGKLPEIDSVEEQE